MTWAKGDTEALRSIDLLALAEDPSAVVYLRRAAAHIEALEARVAELEAERELRTQRFDGLREADAAEVMRLEARVAELENQLLDARLPAIDSLREAQHEARIATLEAANHELRVLYEDGKLHADEMVDLLQDRIVTLEAERDVLNGAWCAENQAEGRGPCGACVTCLRQGTPRAVQEAVDAATGERALREHKRRAGLGLCTHTLHENPQPCSAERRCDECVSDGICDVCRRNEAPDMDRPCAECEAGRAEALMEER